MHILQIDQSESGIKVSLYDDSLGLIDSESFADLYTLNFYLQTVAKKRQIEKGLMVIHDKGKNTVRLSLARDENSFFVDG